MKNIYFILIALFFSSSACFAMGSRPLTDQDIVKIHNTRFECEVTYAESRYNDSTPIVYQPSQQVVTRSFSRGEQPYREICFFIPLDDAGNQQTGSCFQLDAEWTKGKLTDSELQLSSDDGYGDLNVNFSTGEGSYKEDAWGGWHQIHTYAQAELRNCKKLTGN